MTAWNFEVKAYELALTRRRNDVVALPLVDDANWAYGIILHAEEKGAPKAYVYFCEADGQNLPPNRYADDRDAFVLFQPRKRFDDWLDVLRNEAPIYFIADTRSPESASIQTQPEPVGEGERCCVVQQPGTPRPGRPGERPAPATVRDWRPFEPRADGASIINSYLLALASYHIYADEAPGSQSFQDFFRTLFTPWIAAGSNSDPVFDFIDTGTVLPLTGLQGVVMSNSSYVVVCFRGTEINSADWATNLAATTAPVSLTQPLLGGAHAGWVARNSGVYGSLKTTIETHSNNFRKPIWLTGHSVGGVQSTILAQRLAGDGVPIQGIATFGEPALCDAVFFSAYTLSGLAARTQRWVHAADLVAWMPVPAIGLIPGVLFAHPTIAMEFLPPYPPGVTNTNPFDPDAVPDAMLDQIIAFPGIANTADHSIPEYCRKLFGNLDSGTRGAVPAPPTSP